MNYTEHKFLADFQPVDAKRSLLLQIFVFTPLNYAALFGVAWVVGRGLKLGLGM